MNALSSHGRIRLTAGLWLILLFSSIGLIIFFFAASPANASMINILGPTPIPTQENLWAFADLPKPTYTPISTILPTEQTIPPRPRHQVPW